MGKVNSTKREKISELKRWINDEEVFEWWSGGNDTFELYAEKLVNKGIDIEFIKMMFSGLYRAVLGEYE